MVALCWLSRRRSQSQTKLRAIERLRGSIIGNDKAAIAALFGLPRASAGFKTIAPAMLVSSDYFYADTWYYALDRASRAALVVQFDRGIAKDAQVLRTPAR